MEVARSRQIAVAQSAKRVHRRSRRFESWDFRHPDSYIGRSRHVAKGNLAAQLRRRALHQTSSGILFLDRSDPSDACSPEVLMGAGEKPSNELVPGTLDMLVLTTVSRDTIHGYAAWLSDCASRP
jgi:hypothetical protein